MLNILVNQIIDGDGNRERERERRLMIHNLYNLYNVKRVKLATFLMIDAKWKSEKENKVYPSHVSFNEFSATDFRLHKTVQYL